MESCLAVEKEIEKVLSKFSYIDKHTANSLQELLTYVDGIKRELAEAGGSEPLSQSHAVLLGQCVKKIKDTIGRLSSDHKDLHGMVSKVGKAIDKNFTPDFNSIYVEGAFDDDDSTKDINRVICEHFLRQGQLDIAESLIQDAGLDIDVEKKRPFFELHYILESLHRRDLEPALSWARTNRECLQSNKSSLEFKLHRLRFIEYVERGAAGQSDAVLYAKNFSPFAAAHSKELQELMGSLLYVQHGLESSPYSHLLDPVGWTDIAEVFLQDACALLGLSVDSPLSVVVKAGCKALPPLLTIKQVMHQKTLTSVWSSKDELPIEVDLGQDCRFHSVFACPILRQQSTDNNPPVRLICGHVISRDALNKLTSGTKWAPLIPQVDHSGVIQQKVKCPYCPVEQAPSDARQIHF
jgi:hypothetical protein